MIRVHLHGVRAAPFSVIHRRDVEIGSRNGRHVAIPARHFWWARRVFHVLILSLDGQFVPLGGQASENPGNAPLQQAVRRTRAFLQGL